MVLTGLVEHKLTVSEDEFTELRRKMVNSLVKEGILKSEDCIKAMLKVKRHLFVEEKYRRIAYIDSPLPLLDTGQTISAPHMVAYMIEALQLRVGLRVLEVGTGSGYHAAVIAECVAPQEESRDKWGHVITVEVIEKLYEFAKKNLKLNGYSDRVTCILGDGSLGYPPLSEEPLYDRILVTAGSPSIPPPLLKQLKSGGIMIIPVGGKFFQELRRIKKINGRVVEETLMSCLFVPLRGKYGWRD